MPTILDKKVVIRIWKPVQGENRSSAIQSFFQQNINPGHVSIETTSFYASFWPNSRGGIIEVTAKGEIFDKVFPSSILNNRINYSISGNFVKNLTEDERREKRKADTTVELSKLDVEAMNKTFIEFCTNIPNWNFLGHTFINNYAGESCASVAYALLIAGKIENIIIEGCGLKEYISFSFTKVKLTSPETIEDIAKKANEAENSIYAQENDQKNRDIIRAKL